MIQSCAPKAYWVCHNLNDIQFPVRLDSLSWYNSSLDGFRLDVGIICEFVCLVSKFPQCVVLWSVASENRIGRDNKATLRFQLNASDMIGLILNKQCD
jgi:hypothetical protein